VKAVKNSRRVTRSARSKTRTAVTAPNNSKGKQQRAGASSSTRSSLETARRVLRTEADAITALIGRLDGAFGRAVELLAATQGRVIVTGMGKSGLVARKIAATFSSTGTPSVFLHPAEAMHGDMGLLVAGDTVVALSYSGETDEILRLLARMKRLAIPLITMTGAAASTLAQASDVLLDVSIKREACSLNLAPTASTTASLALGDALAIALLERRGFQEDDFAELHPGGDLGRKLKRVKHLMHPVEAIAVVRMETPMRAAVEEISRKGFGMTHIVDGGRMLMGVITDGDLRRLLQSGADLMQQTAGECMTKKPTTIRRDELATRALMMMRSFKITSLPVVNKAGQLEGLLHLHDLLN
jgi:arabinose-5-phosphate isomerase